MMTRVPVRFSSGTAEALKWLALAAMTVDHVNTFLTGRAHPALFAVGRVAFPIFALVLACNLTRPGIDHARLLRRLVFFGLLAAGPFVVMTGHWLPLNVMFTFAVAMAVIALWQRGQDVAAVVVFLAGSLFVDYQWTGVALIVAGWSYFRTGRATAAAATLAALVGLAWPNGSFWALAALPVIAAVEMTAPCVPRLRWAFYAYYPAHLALLALLA